MLFERPFIFGIIAACFCMLSGCDLAQTKSGFNAIDITGANYATDFRLTDPTGNVKTLADFKGKVVLLFFGYTHCPDVCPTTLADAARAVKQLGNDGKRVQVLFVTLDPKRDTPQVLAQYVPAFNPDFLGLYGDEATIRKTAKDFHVFYEERSGAAQDEYSIDHTAGTLVFDPQGRLRLFINYGMTAEKISADLQKLLK